MDTTAQVLAVLIGTVLAAVGALEAFQYRNPRLYPIFLIEPRERDAVRMWTFNLGFYNMTMAAGMLAGVVALHAGHVEQGRALVLFIAAAHVFLGVILFVSQSRLWLSALGQSVPPAVLLGLALT